MLSRLIAATGALLLISSPLWANVDQDLPQQADLMVLGIVLDHPESTKNAFGMTLAPEDPDAMHPSMALCNHDKTERLITEFNDRDTGIVISELLVEGVSARHANCVIPPQYIDHFVSGKGIRLGMPFEEVSRLLGPGYADHLQEDERVISYRIDTPETLMLQRHHAPAYYGQYHFRADRLIKFAIGFELP